MFGLRLFLQNHSPIYAWEELPGEVRALFAAPNGILVRAECFVAERGHRFELWQGGASEGSPVRHKAEVVILQDRGLLTLVSRGGGAAGKARAFGLRPETIESAAYVAYGKRVAR